MAFSLNVMVFLFHSCYWSSLFSLLFLCSNGTEHLISTFFFHFAANIEPVFLISDVHLWSLNFFWRLQPYRMSARWETCNSISYTHVAVKRKFSFFLDGRQNNGMKKGINVWLAKIMGERMCTLFKVGCHLQCNNE